jgi:phospholipase C
VFHDLANLLRGSCTGANIPIEHIVIMMQENCPFDHYFGHLPGNGQDDVDVPATPLTTPDPTGGAPIAWHHEPDYCVGRRPPQEPTAQA